MPRPDALRIVPATESDVPLILSLIKGLAEYERLADHVTATGDDIRESLFGEPRVAGRCFDSEFR